MPFHNISNEINTLFEELGNLLAKSLDRRVKVMQKDDPKTFMKKISDLADVAAIVSTYEAIYLQKSYDLHPFFKLNFSDLMGIVAVAKNSGINRLIELKGKKVTIQKFHGLLFVNPVFLFLLKKSSIVFSSNNSRSFLQTEATQFRKILSGDISAVFSTSFEFNVLPKKERNKIRVIGEFPICPEFIGVAGSGISYKDLREASNQMKIWCEKHPDKLADFGLQFNPIYRWNNQIIVDAIEGLGYTLKGIVEGDNSLFKEDFLMFDDSEIGLLKEKLQYLKTLNDKLVKMYKKVRSRHDQLSKYVDKIFDQTVLFLKDGTILGATRSFTKFLGKSRMEIIGNNITNFIKADIGTSFKNIIKQIDYGLVRSFFVRIQKESKDTVEVKMEFSIIELLDSKVILGRISKLK